MATLLTLDDLAEDAVGCHIAGTVLGYRRSCLLEVHSQ